MMLVQDKKKWETKDGRLLNPKEFDNKHLLNTIHYIEKRGPYYQSRAFLERLEKFDCEQYFTDQEMSIIKKQNRICFLYEFLPIYKYLILEAQKRKLLPAYYLATAIESYPITAIDANHKLERKVRKAHMEADFVNDDGLWEADFWDVFMMGDD